MKLGVDVQELTMTSGGTSSLRLPAFPSWKGQLDTSRERFTTTVSPSQPPNIFLVFSYIRITFSQIAGVNISPANFLALFYWLSFHGEVL